MIAILNPTCSLREKAQVVSLIEERGLRVHLDTTDGREWVGVLGPDAKAIAAELDALPGVQEVRNVNAPYALASRELHPKKTVVRVGDTEIGGPGLTLIAGPGAVESEEQIHATASIVARHGASILRGGTFKPRSSPYSFQGLGLDGLRMLSAAGKAHNLPIVTEVVSAEDVEIIAEHADMLQVGARNMQNFRLLQAVGEAGLPVLLKRSMVATLDEMLLAAEYILDSGTPDVCLCERGIRTFVRDTQNTLDLAAIPLLQERSHLPVLADPSHGTGVRRLVPSLARAAAAAGADGLLIEVHPTPNQALSDGDQSLDPDGFGTLIQELDAIARTLGKSLAPNTEPDF